MTSGKDDLLRRLAEAKGPCITIALPSGGEAAHLKDAIRAVDTPDLAELLGPIRELLNVPVERNANVLIFRSREIFEQVRTPLELEPFAEVGERFALRRLLPVLNDRKEFYLLAISQRQTRLLHCTTEDSGEVALPPGTPSSLGESRQTRQPDHDLVKGGSAGPSVGHMKGVMSGTLTDSDDKNEYLHNFFRELDRAVHTTLNGADIPLVVVAVEQELAIYRQVNTYPHFVEPGVHGSPDGLKGGEMHRRALDLLRSQAPEAARQTLENFDKLVGTGHASVHAHHIVVAAYEGRVEQLFIQENAQYSGDYNEVRQRLKRHVENGHDLLNDAVVETIRHGGTVTLLTGDKMPNGVPVCAQFRY